MPQFLRSYHYSRFIQALFFFGTLMFGFFSISSAAERTISGNMASIILGVFALLSAILFATLFSKVELDDQGIKTIWLWSEKNLSYIDIKSIESTAIENNLILRGKHQKLIVGSQLSGYPEIIEVIRKKRPDLWAFDKSKTFHASVIGYLFFGGIGLGFLFVGVRSLLLGTEIFASWVVIGMGLVTIFFTLSLTWMIEIKDHTIEIKSLLRKQTVHKDDISEIRFSQHDSGNTLVNYAVVIRLMDGKKITLQGVREGTPVLYNALRLWLDSKKIT